MTERVGNQLGFTSKPFVTVKDCAYCDQNFEPILTHDGQWIHSVNFETDEFVKCSRH